MKKNVYNSKIKLLLTFLSILIVLLFINIFFTKNTLIQLDGISFILSAITIPCAIFYFDINKQNVLFIYILIYIIVFMEVLANLIGFKYNFAGSTQLYAPFIYRGILVLLIVYANDNFHNYLIKNKYKTVFSTILNCTVFIAFEFLNKTIHAINLVLKPIFILFMFYYFITVLKLFFKSYKESNFLLTIYNFSLITLILKMIFYVIGNVLKINITDIIILYKLFFVISFGSIVLGLFIEFKYLIIENKKLIKDVEIISNDIREYRVLDKVRSQFFANLSHELKTPLNIIFSFVQLIDLEKSDDYINVGKSYSKYSNSIKQNCYRMIRLINNLVDLTKIDSGYMNMSFHNYDIVNLVEDITMSVVPYMESKKINIIFDTFIEELEIRCDSDSIERIMLNLLSNSIKFSNENGNIVVFMDADHEYVTIKVMDDGIGIEKEKQEKVFDIFVQSDKSMTRKNEGSGIGLSLVKSLVKLHDGEVYLNSEINKGTEIIIKLPNIRLEKDIILENDFHSKNKSLVSKIKIEFSDIYNF